MEKKTATTTEIAIVTKTMVRNISKWSTFIIKDESYDGYGSIIEAIDNFKSVMVERQQAIKSKHIEELKAKLAELESK